MTETVGFEESPKQSDGDRLAEIRALLEYGKTFRQENRETAWLQSEAQYSGDHWGSTRIEDPTADLITINLSFSTVNTIVPYVTSSDPRFLVSPYSKDATIQNARLQQAWLNRLWRKQSTGAHGAVTTSAEDYLIYGDGYMKVSYAILEKMLSGGEADSATVADIFVDRIDPWDMYLDPMADGIHNARWLCHRIYTTKREIERDESYAEADMDLLVGSAPDVIEDDARGSRTSAHGDTTQDWVVLYEFYDLVDKEMWTFTDNGEIPLRRVTGIELAPIVQLGNYRIPRSPYHMGELEQLWPMQQELNKSRSQLITHRRRNVAKYLIREDAITDEGREALQSPIVNQMVPIKGEIPLEALVKPAQLAPLPPEAYASADQALRDIYEISGVNEYLRGASPEIRRTATEASIIEGASNVKTRAKLSDVEQAVRKVGTLIVETAKAVYPDTDVDELAMFLTGGEAQKVAREEAGIEADGLAEQGMTAEAQQVLLEGEQSDVVVTPTEEIFVGQYEIDVEVGSTEMRSPAFKEQKYRDMAQTLVQMQEPLQMAGVNINLRKVFELWFEAAQITDVDGMFADQQQQQAPIVPPGAEGLPPEIAALMAQGGAPPGLAPPGGVQPGEGQPNLQAAQAPIAPIDDTNTGALAPAI